MKPLNPIVSRESPRQILAEDYANLGGEMPISGGWGYTQADACVIDKNDPIVDQSAPFDGVAIEYSFVQKRSWEEMIIFRDKGEKFAGIDWKLLQQSTHMDGGRVYDRLEFQITAFPQSKWEELKAEWEGPDGHQNPRFDHEAHEKKRAECRISLTREFWFDITSFFGQR